jgi:serine/threonine-protein kinase
MFDNETAQKSYTQTFAEAGYNLIEGDPQEVAERIRRSPVAEPILEAIDNWALVCTYDIEDDPRPEKPYRQRRNQLLSVARAVDPHPELRDRIRDPKTWDNRRQLEELAELAPQTDLSPRLAALLAELLRWAKGNPERLLRTFQRRYPGDFWLNFDLGKWLDRTKPIEALRFYQAALAVRPHHAIVLSHMGINLRSRRHWDESIAHFEEALTRADETESIGLRNNLATVLYEKGDIEGAVALLRENVRLRPTGVRTQFSLGVGLVHLGKFDDALESFRRAHQLATETGSRFRVHAGQAVREVERLMELDRRLSAGKPEPKDADESLGFAEVCFCKTHYADAVEFYRRAFAQDSKVADVQHRYEGAWAAILAASGRGAGTESLDASHRAELRKQALTWLRANLDDCCQHARDAHSRPGIDSMLRLWQRHPNLSGVRDPAAIAQLPADERPAWQQLWTDVEALLGRVQEAN